jgi:epoxide hydrolase-like predicted phosphatase
MAKIKAVIFDWGGVLIEDPLPRLLQYCADAFGVSKKEYIKAHNKFADDFTKGKVDEKTFWGKVCGELGKPLPETPSLWSNAFRAIYHPRADMFSMVSSLHKAGFKTALLSNTEVTSVQFFHRQKHNMFDVLVFSCTEGTAKPERKIYEIAIERLGTTPAQTVFIDDNPEFIKGAKQAGLNTILFRDIERLKKELSQFGVM